MSSISKKPEVDSKAMTTEANMVVELKEPATKNSIRNEDIDYKTRIKRHTERENEIERRSFSDTDQVRRAARVSPEGLHTRTIDDSEASFRNEVKMVEGTRERHPPEEIGNYRRPTLASSASPDISRSLPASDGPGSEPAQASSDGSKSKENRALVYAQNDLIKLTKQNSYLMETILKLQETHKLEKKRFHETLFGIDKALSSLPIRLEKIRLRNQRNLSIIKSTRFQTNDNISKEITENITPSEESSRGSNFYPSCRMKCFLNKMEQLNELIKTLNQGNTTPIELLVNSELYAISLLKKEIKSTKKQIDESKTDTETMISVESSFKQNSLDGSSPQSKALFSSELHKASNFKIFENHMMLQEEALNLLTKKIKKTEESLLKEVKEKESLKKENENLTKEIFKLKSVEEENKESKPKKGENLKADEETGGARPFKMIKELKAQLEEKDKSLAAWKSKCTRVEAANLNKNTLLENEKKKNSGLEATIKSLRSQVKSMTLHTNSVQFVNEQLKEQIEILKHQVEILANTNQSDSTTKKSEIREHIYELRATLKTQETKVNKVEREAEEKIREIQSSHEKEMNIMRKKFKKSEHKNKEYLKTFKELLTIITNFEVECEGKSTKNPSYNRIREILHLSSSELDLLFSVHPKSSTGKELENLFEQCQFIVHEKESEFSASLSNWLFTVIADKLLRLPSTTCDNNEH